MKRSIWGPLYSAAETAHKRPMDPYKSPCPYCGVEPFRKCVDREGCQRKPHGYRVNAARMGLRGDG